jgi:hypothetical protein
LDALLSSTFHFEISEVLSREKGRWREMTTPTTTQAGGEKRIEYYRLKAARLKENTTCSYALQMHGYFLQFIGSSS